jgi:hypothetical protein
MNLYLLIALGRVRCISLLVKSLKDSKFVTTDAMKSVIFGRIEITFCPRFTQTSSDLHKSRYTNKMSERHTIVKAVTVYFGTKINFYPYFSHVQTDPNTIQ